MSRMTEEASDSVSAIHVLPQCPAQKMLTRAPGHHTSYQYQSGRNTFLHWGPFRKILANLLPIGNNSPPSWSTCVTVGVISPILGETACQADAGGTEIAFRIAPTLPQAFL